MSLFLNCGWHPLAGMEIQARIGQVVRLLEREETIAIMGRNWYRQGRSKKEALSKPLSLAKLTDVRSWGRGKVIIERTGREEIDYSLGIWNGRDDPEAASFMADLNEPPTEPDTLLFSGPRLESLKDKWHHVLAWGEAVAIHLGGRSFVGSDELRDWAEAEGLEGAALAGYAAFNGRDGRSIVGAATWPEVIAPDKKRVQELIEKHRAMVEPDLRRWSGPLA
jgi:hypothetical protein